MKSNKTKAAMLGCSLCCLLLCAALLLPLTMGKYGSKIDGFISFDAGSFNAAITQTETLVSDGEGGTKSIFVEYSVFDFKPGMSMTETDTGSLSGTTAATTKFRIANGNNEEDAASTPLQYTIRIRTSNSLPLKYTLKSVMEPERSETETGSVAAEPTVVYHTPLAEPTVITEELSEPRYEYQFNEVPLQTAEEDTPAEGEVTPSEGEPDTPVEYTEVTFLLEQGTADSKYVYREHELIAEWSADPEFAQSKYMKEVEIVEILVTVVSVNKTDDPDYQLPDNPVTGGHASGILIVSPVSGATENSYKYELDLRSFKADNNGNDKGSFVFTLHNGFGLGLDTEAWAADYTMTLKMPADLAKGYTYTADDGTEKTVAPWTFKVYRNEIVVEDMMVGAAVTYTVRDLKTGKDITDDAGNTKFADYDAAVAALNELYKDEDPEKTKTHAVYVSYQLNLREYNRLFYQKPGNTGAYGLAADKHGFTIRSNQCLTEMTNEVAFLNKLEILVETTLVPLPPPSVETTAPTPEPAPEPTE